MTKKEYKTRIAQQYSLSEEDIDDSLIPIFISQVRNEKSQKQQFEELGKSIETALAEQKRSYEELTKKIKELNTTQSVANFKESIVRAPRWGWYPWFFLTLMTACGIFLYNNAINTEGERYKALEKVIQYDVTTRQFYIYAKDYRTQNNKNFKGIIIQRK